MEELYELEGFDDAAFEGDGFDEDLGEVEDLEFNDVSLFDDMAFEGDEDMFEEADGFEEIAYQAVLEGGFEGVYEAAEQEQFLGGLAARALKRVGKIVARRLAKWAKRTVAKKLGRFGKRAVREAYKLLSSVAKQTVKQVLAYATSKRVFSVVRLWGYAKKRFWANLKAALAKRGIRVSEAEAYDMVY